MKQVEPGQRLRIYVGEGDHWRGKLLYTAIVQAARKQGLAGATVARGVMGYGAHSAVHEPHLFELHGQLPVVIEIVDTSAKIAAFLPYLDEMVQEGLITVSEVSIVRYSKG